MENKKSTANINNNTGINPNDLQKLLSNANDMQETLKSHIIWDNKRDLYTFLPYYLKNPLLAICINSDKLTTFLRQPLA